MKWQWQADELHAHWYLTTEESDLLYKKTPHGRLGFFVVLLKYFQNEGHNTPKPAGFLLCPQKPPSSVE